MIRSLNDVLGRVAQLARGRSRRRDGASSSVSAPAEDPAEGSGAVRGGKGRRGRGARRRSPSPVAAAASEEEEDEGDHQQEEEGDQHQEDEEQEDEEGGEEEEEEGEAAIPAIWQRGPSRLPERPIPLERWPIIRPDGKR